MSATPQPISPQAPQAAGQGSSGGRSSGAAVALMVVIWVVWLGVSLVADLLALLMFAFADAPGSAASAQAMIAPAFAWVAFTFVAGAVLLLLRKWWQIGLAFVLAVSPPFAVFAGYNLLDGASGVSRAPGSNAAAPATTPARRVVVPPGGFAPAPMKVPEQPDFRKAIDAYRTAAATRPVTSTTQP
jgi:hypothetical protein